MLVVSMICGLAAPVPTARAADDPRAEQQRLRAELERLNADLQRSSGARSKEEERLQEVLASEAAARRSLRDTQSRRAEAARALEQAEAQLAAQRWSMQITLDRLRDLARLHVLARQRAPATDRPDLRARNTAWLRHVGRERAALLTTLDQQTRQLEALTREQRQANAALEAEHARQREQLRTLDALATEHRNTLAALQRQQHKESRAREQLQQRLAALDELMVRLRQRPGPTGAMTGLQPIKLKARWPYEGPVLQRFGSRSDYTDGPMRGTLHASAMGSEIPALHDGTVAWVGWLPRMGLTLLIDHGRDYFSLYAHAESVLYGVGDAIAAGAPVILSGRSGSPPQAALYVEIRKGRTPLNPRQWFLAAP